MFHGKNAKGIGGGAGNHTKSMRDKSGSEVVLKDDDGSITIKDKAGDMIQLDGTDYIEVNAIDHVKVTNGKCTIEMKENNIDITAVDQFKITVGGNTFTMTPDTTTLETPVSVSVQSAQNLITGENHITGGNTTIDGGEDVKISSSNAVDIGGGSLIDLHAVLIKINS